MSVENWIEIGLLIIVLVIVHAPDEALEDACNTKRCLAAIAILLSWAGNAASANETTELVGGSTGPGSSLLRFYRR